MNIGANIIGLVFLVLYIFNMITITFTLIAINVNIKRLHQAVTHLEYSVLEQSKIPP